jgi:hypothetical protein
MLDWHMVHIFRSNTAGMRVGSWQACRQIIFHSQSKSTQKQAKTEGRSKQITSSKLTTGTLKASVIEIIETEMQYPANSNNFLFQLQYRTSLATIQKRNRFVPSSQIEVNSTHHSSSWLRRRALPFVTETFNCAARSTIAFLFSVETLCAISALYFLQSCTGQIKPSYQSITDIDIRNQALRSSSQCVSQTTQKDWRLV